MSAKKYADLLKAIQSFYRSSEGFDGVMKTVNIKSLSEGICVAELKVLPEHTNRLGTLHGGCTATIVDNITTCAQITKDGNPGVTINLNINYLTAAKVGEEIVIEARATRTGRTLAYLDCIIKNKKDDSIVATGSQVKFVKR